MSALQDRHTVISNTLGSAVAGIVSRICTHPIDTAKSRLQMQYKLAPGGTAKNPPHYRGTLDVLIKTFRTEGIRGLYRGFGAILVGGTPGTVTYLCTYEFAKDHLGRLKQGSSITNHEGGDFLVHFSAGMIAETVACIIYVPVDVIKERLQVQHTTYHESSDAYKGSLDALKRIAKTEGLSGIYKGYAATLASFGPFSALYFVFYEKSKAETRQYLFGNSEEPVGSLNNRHIPFSWLILCSASSGALASWLTSPLDMAKLRLQVQRGESYKRGNVATTSSSSILAYRGVLDCLQTVYRQSGIRGLFRGAGARVCFYAPATGVTMSCYDACRSFVSKLLAEE